jgi:hypothetical protein
MSEPVCGLAAETKVETPEGAMTIRSVAGKNVSVFTREEGRVRFRRMLDVRKVAEQQPVLELTLETGESFRVAPEQVLYKKGMIECRADQLRAGDELEPAFHYPELYEFKDDSSGAMEVSGASLRVTAVGNGGVADVFTLSVNQTGCFFVSAGVLCRAAGRDVAGS